LLTNPPLNMAASVNFAALSCIIRLQNHHGAVNALIPW
jgi:hypothetical protein